MITIVVEQIRKRDGRIVPFQEEKIANAIKKAFQATGQQADAKALTDKVLDMISNDVAKGNPLKQVQTVRYYWNVVEALRPYVPRRAM